MSGKIVFIYLYAFDLTGGIEKYNRAFMKALYEFRSNIIAISVYDSTIDERYIPSSRIKNCAGNHYQFIKAVLFNCLKADKIFIGHIHLLPFAILVKVFNPFAKVIFNIHGVEVWNKFPFIKRYAFRFFYFVSVSRFTAKKFAFNNNIDNNRISVLPNCIDPFLKIPLCFEKPQYLLKKYSLSSTTKVLLAITRMSAKENNKNYLKVIQCIPQLKLEVPDIVFILAGNATNDELLRLKAYASALNIKNNLILPGFIPDAELVDHYLLADTYVLPSKKEGFGISFIESLFCGCSVIAGNTDGSIEDLRSNQTGYFINPDSEEELLNALITSLQSTPEYFSKRNISDKCLAKYSFFNFSEGVKHLIRTNFNNVYSS